MSFVPPRGLLAVLAVVDIALNTTQRPLSAKTLAARYNLAPRYLEPMLQMLVQVGILRGIRGPHGGYRLGRAASELTVDDIFRAALAATSDPHPFLGKNPLVTQVIVPSLDGAECALSHALSSVTIESLAVHATALGLTN
jgi:Rrf2 family iron-sulfur cluster assembly transcriptional regulator